MYKYSNTAKVTMAYERRLSDGNKSRDETKSKKAKTLANEIHDACLTGEIEKVKSLLKENRLESAGIKELNKKKTIINLSENGKAELSKELLKNGVNPNCKNNEGQTPLHLACYHGHVNVVMELLNHGANVKAKSNDKESPLVSIDVWELEDEISTNIARKLLEHGADVNSKTKDGDTLLHLAAIRGYYSLLCELLKNGADVNAKDSTHKTPLHGAANCDIVRELIRYGTSINAIDQSGDTPLHVASEYGNETAVEEILRHNPKLNIMNNEGQTPIELAFEYGEAMVIKKFLKQNNTGKNIVIDPLFLHYAAKKGHIEVVNILLENGVKTDERDKENDNTTPLHMAAKEGQLAVVRKLLECGADINAQSHSGQTPIHKLLNIKLCFPILPQTWLMVMKVLLDERYNIDLTLKCSKGLTPLETAIKLGRLNMARTIAKVLCPKPKITDSIYPLKRFL